MSSDVSLAATQFAAESAFHSRADVQFRLTSDDQYNDLRFLGFYETGDGGDWNVDLDPVVFRPRILETGHLWFGRANPLSESREGFRPQLRTGAIGANWSQNQLNALEPRVSGWIGIGVHQRHSPTGLFVTASYSPVFLPSFGPALTLSEDSDASGARFTRLPPARVQVSDTAMVPLRYRLETGDLLEILAKPQAFVAIGHETAVTHLTLMAWSGRSPDPKTDVDGKLRARTENVDVLATVKPIFPRENFVGSRLILPNLWGAPELQFAHELISGRTSMSVMVAPRLFDRADVQLGILDTVNRPAPAGSGQPATPYYSDLLVWTQIESPLSSRLNAKLRYEQHLTLEEEGAWVQPGLSYRAEQNLVFFAHLNLIVGQDLSYFGSWRSLDSFAVGARAIW